MQRAWDGNSGCREFGMEMQEPGQVWDGNAGARTGLGWKFRNQDRFFGRQLGWLVCFALLILLLGGRFLQGFAL